MNKFCTVFQVYDFTISTTYNIIQKYLKIYLCISDTEMSTLSSWASGQPWSFDSMGIPRSAAPPQPPNSLPPIAYSTACRRHQNSSGSSGLGSTSDEITYPQISKYYKLVGGRGFSTLDLIIFTLQVLQKCLS